MANENKRHPGRPKQLVWEKCKVEGCENTTQKGGFGMCRTHYMQVRRGMRSEDGALLRGHVRVAPYSGVSCVADGCGNKPVANALCAKHYQQWRNGASFEGLPHQEIRPYLRGQTCCCVDGCDIRPVNRGMCSKHAQQREAGILDAEGRTLRAFNKRPRSDRWVGRTGYVLVRAPEGHPKARVDGSILEHRLVMEQTLGRFLEEHEIVHHKDGNRQNNDISNLELLDGRACRGVGHPPAHDFDVQTAVQILLQCDDLSATLRTELEAYRRP